MSPQIGTNRVTTRTLLLLFIALLALGSGDPTRAICSTLIAQCFQCINYPILPRTIPGCAADILQTRHHSLFVPRDFDVSPYFEIVKPTLVTGFD